MESLKCALASVLMYQILVLRPIDQCIRGIFDGIMLKRKVLRSGIAGHATS